MFFKRTVDLWTQIRKSSYPFRYFVSRLFVNFPYLFKLFYFKRKNYKLRLSSTQIASIMFANPHEYQFSEENFLLSLMKKDGWFIDIGANIGYLSISLKKNLPNIDCLAIEANPKTFKNLKDNIDLNKIEIKSICCVVGEIDKNKIEFQDSDIDDCNSVISKKMLKKDIKDKDMFIVGHKNSFNVITRTLDSLCEEFSITKKVRLIKVDTEGYELLVFKGGKKILKNTEIIFFECWDKLYKKYDYLKEDVFVFLQNLGFEIYKIKYPLFNDKFIINSLELVTPETNFNKNQNLVAINKNL